MHKGHFNKAMDLYFEMAPLIDEKSEAIEFLKKQVN